MPYPQKTLSSLQASAWNDIVASNVMRGVPLLPRSILRVLSWMFANLVWGNYDYLSWCARQSVPWTAEAENLDAWAALRGVYKKNATAASGLIVFSGCAPGTVLDSGTAVMRADGVSYTTLAPATAGADGSLSVSVLADAVGADGNCDSGTLFALLTSIDGMPSTGAASGPLIGGADVEQDNVFRTRMLQAYASRDGGGRNADYIEWATAVPGVTRAWCNPNGAGIGSVVIYVMLDAAQATHNGFPQGSNGAASDETRSASAEGDQLVVANTIRPSQPVTALVLVCAPIPFPIDIVLTDAMSITSSQLASMQNALADLYMRIGSPLGSSIPESTIEGALISTGATFTLVYPAGPVSIPLGYLPVVGALSAK